MPPALGVPHIEAVFGVPQHVELLARHAQAVSHRIAEGAVGIGARRVCLLPRPKGLLVIRRPRELAKGNARRGVQSAIGSRVQISEELGKQVDRHVRTSGGVMADGTGGEPAGMAATRLSSRTAATRRGTSRIALAGAPMCERSRVTSSVRTRRSFGEWRNVARAATTSAARTRKSAARNSAGVTRPAPRASATSHRSL